MKTIFYLFLLVPFFSFAQKIKTKKDRILIDEKEVAIFNDKVRDQCVFFDLNNTKQFTVEYKSLMPFCFLARPART